MEKENSTIADKIDGMLFSLSLEKRLKCWELIEELIAERLCNSYNNLGVEKRTRYFFVCTMGKNPNGSTAFNNFDIQTTYGHPTFKRCIEISNEKFPNLRETILLSISEISEEDWKVFTSQQ